MEAHVYRERGANRAVCVEVVSAPIGEVTTRNLQGSAVYGNRVRRRPRMDTKEIQGIWAVSEGVGEVTTRSLDATARNHRAKDLYENSMTSTKDGDKMRGT